MSTSSSTFTGGPPWYHHFNFDTLLRIFNSVFLHPIISLFLPLMFLALSHSPSSLPVRNGMIYASIVNLIYFAQLANTRLASGGTRPLNLENELILITGGGSGLGLLLAEVYGLRGVSVAVLDINIPAEAAETRGVTFYTCDVSDPAAVEAAKRQIEEDFDQSVTIVIHAAATVCAGSTESLSYSTVRRGLATNLESAFTLVRLFLPSMRSSNSGTIVLISSILGALPASQTSVYSASKAGLTALHHSLTAELGKKSGVKTVLVTAGQMGTGLFNGVVTPSWFFAPVLEPVEVAKEVIRLVDEGRGGEVSMPAYAKWVGIYYCLPGSVQRLLRHWSAIDTAMAGYGRKSKGEGEEGKLD